VHPEDRPLLEQAVERACATGLEFSLDHRIVLPDGVSRTLHSRGQVVLNDAGEPIRMVGTGQDITDRKRLEEQLRQAQKMEAVGQLAGGVAHDFNNMLTVITGYSETLVRELAPGDPRREEVAEIRKAAERAATLTRQLLAFSRRQMLAPRVLDLNAVVADHARMLPRLIGEDVDLVTVLRPAVSRVKVDRGQLEQVLMNLAVNARDAMPHGGRLTIETSQTTVDEAFAARHRPMPPGDYVVLAVGDTGSGMDPVTQAHVFEPFFTTKEQGKGTGLGLATVYGIVKQSDGYIWVSTAPGQGTTFKIFLPPTAAPADDSERPTDEPAPTRGTETVLLVEDEDQLRKLGGEVLRAHGYTVLEAREGDEALELAERQADPIHVLVSDVVMPGMNGRELALRLTGRRPGLKVLLMSGYADRGFEPYGLAELGLGFIQKPFKPNDLLEKVRELLDAEPIAIG
jgi:signal transduction histidine kinase